LQKLDFSSNHGDMTLFSRGTDLSVVGLCHGIMMIIDRAYARELLASQCRGRNNISMY